MFNAATHLPPAGLVYRVSSRQSEYRACWDKRVTAALTVVHITVGESKRALTVTLAASPVAVIHALPVRKHETLVSIGRGVEVRHSAMFVIVRRGPAENILWHSKEGIPNCRPE